jgi:hypothetical protein
MVPSTEAVVLEVGLYVYSTVVGSDSWSLSSFTDTGIPNLGGFVMCPFVDLVVAPLPPPAKW